MEVLKDFLASRVISSGKELDGYSKVYFKSNENLLDLYRKVDFLDKDVFSVLASSDQVFTAYYNGACKVDSFDKNPLAVYYYYLRVWTVRYMNEVYPLEVLQNNYDWLLKLLMKVKVNSSEEEDALKFWKKHLIYRTDLEGLFYEDIRKNKTPFKTVNSIGSVVDFKTSFKVIDLFDKVNINSKYDVILLSNIIEWSRNDEYKMTMVSDNLDKILKKDGIILCSELLNRDDLTVQKERRIFDSNFDYYDYGRGVGYIYKKR